MSGRIYKAVLAVSFGFALLGTLILPLGLVFFLVSPPTFLWLFRYLASACFALWVFHLVSARSQAMVIPFCLLNSYAALELMTGIIIQCAPILVKQGKSVVGYLFLVEVVIAIAIYFGLRLLLEKHRSDLMAPAGDFLRKEK